jgi:hypothetical protein
LELHKLDVDAARRMATAWASEAHELSARAAEVAAEIHDQALSPLAARRLHATLDRERWSWLLTRLDELGRPDLRGLNGPIQEVRDPERLRAHAAALRDRAARLVARSGFAASYLPRDDELMKPARDLGRAHRALRSRVQTARVEATEARVIVGRLLASRAEPDRVASAEQVQMTALAKLAALDQLLAHLTPLPAED